MPLQFQQFILAIPYLKPAGIAVSHRMHVFAVFLHQLEQPVQIQSEDQVEHVHEESSVRDHQLQNIKVNKVLITVNRTTKFAKTYSFIYYLSDAIKASSRSIISSRSVYNNYGLTFFFDLFFHDYFIATQNK